MKGRSVLLRLNDILEAIARLREALGGASIEEFEADWQKTWIVERGLEIISEASRHLPAALKDRHPQIPWQDIAGIGNVLRHDYERVSPPILWKVAKDDLDALEQACRVEQQRELAKYSSGN